MYWEMARAFGLKIPKPPPLHEELIEGLIEMFGSLKCRLGIHRRRDQNYCCRCGKMRQLERGDLVAWKYDKITHYGIALDEDDGFIEVLTPGNTRTKVGRRRLSIINKIPKNNGVKFVRVGGMPADKIYGLDHHRMSGSLEVAPPSEEEEEDEMLSHVKEVIRRGAKQLAARKMASIDRDQSRPS